MPTTYNLRQALNLRHSHLSNTIRKGFIHEIKKKKLFNAEKIIRPSLGN